MNIRLKFFLQFCTVIYSTFASIIETSILYRSFNLNILGTFFLLQSSTILLSSILSIRIVETTQVLLNKFGLSERKAYEQFSKLYSFYLIILIPLIPLSLILIPFFKDIYKYNILTILLSLLFISSTIILNKLTGVWYAFQYFKNKSQNISFYELTKKLISILLIYLIYLFKPSSYEIIYISLAYFLKSFLFFIYEFNIIYPLIKSKIIYSFKKPLKIFKEFTISNTDISSSIKSSYLRNLFSSIVKNSDIAIAGIIAGPAGSSLVKIIKSVPTIILQPSQYINNFSISYINRSRKSYRNLYNFFISISLKLLPLALIISIVYFYISSPFLMFVYQIKLTYLENFIQTFLLFLSFFVLIFSWAIPLHIFKNQYNSITKNSLFGSILSMIFLLAGFIFKMQELIYISLIFGIFTTFTLNTISHHYKLNFSSLENKS